MALVAEADADQAIGRKHLPLPRSTFTELDELELDQRASLRTHEHGALRATIESDASEHATCHLPPVAESFQSSRDLRIELSDDQRPQRELFLQRQLEARGKNARQAIAAARLRGDRREVRARDAFERFVYVASLSAHGQLDKESNDARPTLTATMHHGDGFDRRDRKLLLDRDRTPLLQDPG
ncbi:MAG: hypothetical protein ABI678_17330 [Kofleriaceae bacterium]